jgi:hypothetical protein
MAYSILIYNILRVHHYTTVARLHTLTHTFFWNKKWKRKTVHMQLQNLKVVGY